MSTKIMIVLSSIFLVICLIHQSVGNPYPALDLMGGYDFLGVCLRNCAQCKKMLGSYFEGQLCADACIKLKGKVIPDCEDLASISAFLNKVD